MAQQNLNVVVEANTYQFATGIVQFVEDVVPLLKDGFNVLKIPAVLSSLLTNVVPALELISKLKDEEKEDPVAFAAALEMKLNDLVAALLK